MLRTGSAIVALALAPTWAAGRVLRVDASVSAQQVPAGSSFELVVSAEVEGDGADLPWPEVQLPAEIVAGGRNRTQESRTQVSWVNGAFQKSSTTVVRFHLGMNTGKPGTYTLGPVTFQGRNLGSGRIVVGSPATGSSSASASANDVRTSTLVARRKVWVGQQVPFTWRLESDLPLQTTTFPDIRSIFGQGFYSAVPDSQGQAKVFQRPDGRNFARLDWKGTLFPLRAGRQNLPSTQLSWKTIEGGSVDPFEAMMRGEDPFEAMQRRPRVREGVARTEIVPLEIQPVPEKGRPPSFQGGVGQFRLEAALQAPSPRVGQGATLVIKLAGNGQPQASGLPLWTAPPTMEAYPPQDTWASTWKDGELVTTLERRIVVVPRKAGKIEFDSVRFAWFDPLEARFRIASVGLPALQVAEPVSSSSWKPSTDSAKDSAALTGRDRFWIRFGQASAILWSLLATGLAAWIAVGIVRTRYSRQARRRRALRQIEARLRAASSLTSPSAGALRRDLVEALALVHGDAASGWTSREVGTHLEPSWGAEPAEEFAALLRELEAAEYAGFPVEECGPRVERILARLGKDLPA